MPNQTELLTPAEVAWMFRVDPKTVTRWSKQGRLITIRTLGGHRRYPTDQPAFDHIHDLSAQVAEVRGLTEM